MWVHGRTAKSGRHVHSPGMSSRNGAQLSEMEVTVARLPSTASNAILLRRRRVREPVSGNMGRIIGISARLCLDATHSMIPACFGWARCACCSIVLRPHPRQGKRGIGHADMLIDQVPPHQGKDGVWYRVWYRRTLQQVRLGSAACHVPVLGLPVLPLCSPSSASSTDLSARAVRRLHRRGAAAHGSFENGSGIALRASGRIRWGESGAAGVGR